MATKKSSKNKGLWQVYRRCLALALQNKGALLVIFLFSLFSAALSIVSSMTLKYIVDIALPEKNITLLWIYQAVFFLCVLASSALGILAVHFGNRIWIRVQKDLRGKLYSHLLELDYAHLQSLEAGKLQTLFGQAVDALEEIFLKGISIALGYVISIGITLAVMFATDWRLTLFSLPVYPLMIALFAKLNKSLGKVFSGLQDTRSKLHNSTLEGVDCFVHIRTQGLQKAQEQSFAEDCEALGQAMGKRNLLFEVMNRASWTLIMVPYQAILFGVGGTLAILHGLPTVGTLLIFSNFTNYLIQPVMGLTGIGSQLSMAEDSFARIDELLALPKQASPDYAEPVDSQNFAELYQLHFAYKEGEKAVVENLSHSFAKGQSTVLWGKSGSGKSTLLKLLAGLLLPIENSQIRKDKALTLAYFPQNPMLFEDSVRNNFLRVLPSIEEAHIWQVLDSVGLAEVIKNKENGLDCHIPRKENGLSGGEYRRLCLAVFLAKKADILLFDEPTASLDAHSAEQIAKVLENLAKDKHSLVIASHDEILKNIGDTILHLG